jgi:hypothetical protein
MRHPVDFDNELSVDGHKVNDVSVDGMLAPEFPTSQPAIA